MLMKYKANKGLQLVRKQKPKLPRQVGDEITSNLISLVGNVWKVWNVKKPSKNSAIMSAAIHYIG